MENHFDRISRNLSDDELQLRIDQPNSFQADAVISAANELKRRLGKESYSLEITKLVNRIEEDKLKSEEIEKANRKKIEEFEYQIKGRITSFGERFLAYLLDCIIIMAPMMIIITTISIGFKISNIWDRKLLLDLISLIVWFGYYVGWETSSFKATPGKLILKLKVVNSSGERLSIKIAVIRYFSRLLSVLTFGIGFLAILTEPRKRALHDRLSKSYVVYRAKRFDNNLLIHGDINAH